MADPSAVARDIRLKLLRTVHGPVTKTAHPRGKPVAISLARSTYMHELDSALAFKRLSRNEVTDARSFQRTMSTINFLFNWFYSDERDIAYLQSGWFPLRARGTDPSLPDARHRALRLAQLQRRHLQLGQGVLRASCRRTSTRGAATS